MSIDLKSLVAGVTITVAIAALQSLADDSAGLRNGAIMLDTTARAVEVQRVGMIDVLNMDPEEAYSINIININFTKAKLEEKRVGFIDESTQYLDNTAKVIEDEVLADSYDGNFTQEELDAKLAEILEGVSYDR